MIRTVTGLGKETLEAATDEPGAMPRRTTINTALRQEEMYPRRVRGQAGFRR